MICLFYVKQIGMFICLSVSAIFFLNSSCLAISKIKFPYNLCKNNLRQWSLSNSFALMCIHFGAGLESNNPLVMLGRHNVFSIHFMMTQIHVTRICCLDATSALVQIIPYMVTHIDFFEWLEEYLTNLSRVCSALALTLDRRTTFLFDLFGAVQFSTVCWN